jgi:hypothetical protein
MWDARPVRSSGRRLASARVLLTATRWRYRHGGPWDLSACGFRPAESSLWPVATDGCLHEIETVRSFIRSRSDAAETTSCTQVVQPSG